MTEFHKCNFLLSTINFLWGGEAILSSSLNQENVRSFAQKKRLKKMSQSIRIHDAI